MFYERQHTRPRQVEMLDRGEPRRSQRPREEEERLWMIDVKCVGLI